LPSDFQTTLLETNIVRPEVISKRIGDAALIGSAQIRVRYRFQQPLTKPDTKRKSCILKPVSSQQETIQNNRLSMPEITMTQPIDNKQIDHQQHDEVNHDLLHLTTVDSNSSHASRRSSYGRGDLAQDEKYVSGIFKDRLINIMSVHIPGSAEQSLRSTSSLRKKGSIRDLLRKNKLSKESMSSSSLNSSRSTRGFEWFHNLVSPSKKLPNSASGRRYGFSQNDSEDNHRFNPDGADDDSSISASKPVTDRLAHGAKKRAQHIIDSVNFGDRSFASQWMEDSFEDVALSHPIVDKLIGLVVSKQTQAMVRAIIKTANSFGQGFRVTGAKLFKSFLLVQKFYESIPKPVSTKAIHDIDLIDSACHYFAFALVAYVGSQIL
jgi:hypothetical protein